MIRDSRKIAAILAADVVDYSRLMGADEAATLAALKARRAIFEELVREFEGREFGSVGDSLMAAFQSAVNAVSCALEIQQRVASENAPLAPARRMHLRIGVNLGDVIDEKGSLFGDAVNVAARLQALAKPAGVLISGAVYDQVHLKIPARYISAGTRQVKNIEESVRTFEVLPAESPGFFGRVTGAFVHLASRRVLRAMSTVALLTAAVALGLFWREIPVPGTGGRLGSLLRPASDAPPPNSIAVLPFLNMSGDSRDDYLGNGLAEELSHRLAKIPGLHVAARTSAFAVMGKNLGVTEIANRLGVSYVVEGSVKRQVDRVRVNAALVEAGSGSSRWSNTYEVRSDDFFTIESDIGNQVLIALELVLGTDAGTAESPHPEGSEAAYDLFLQGLSWLRQPKSAKTLNTAEQLFRRALAEQPDFARAQAGLCETQVERYALERVPALVTAAEEACARARALDSSAQEVHEAVGRLRLATGDAAEAVAAYRRALTLVPQSPDALIGLAFALAAGGDAAEAEPMHQRAIAAQPRYAYAHIAYGNFLFGQGRPTEAVMFYERATILAPDNPNAFNNLGSAYMLAGDFDRASRALERSIAIEPRRGSYSGLGSVQYYLGRYELAEDMFRKAIELAPADHRVWGNLADTLRFDARPDEAQEAYRRALELADGELAINPKHAINQAQAAYYAVQLGDDGRARHGIARALPEGDDSNYVHYYVALAELGLGDRVKALAHLRRARQLGYPESLLKAAPELGDIRTML
ncbi:MAG TPA: tetratricopeptide repeat protein [Steroidobacteraceae bacterium]|nr:tetratricopeptide repeat protein [Steroidobacteraceae bacterium]